MSCATSRTGVSALIRRPYSRLASLALTGIATVWLSLALTVFALGDAVARQPQLDLPRTTVTIETATGSTAFEVQIADSYSTRAKGLMFRRDMPTREGMLFEFFEERDVSFWMENTPSSLDLIFIRADGEVRHIARDAVPYSRAPIPSNGPVRYVLEVNAGVADEIGLAPGDRVEIAPVGE